MGPPQMGGENGPLELVSPWIGYRVLKKNINIFLPKKSHTTNYITLTLFSYFSCETFTERIVVKIKKSPKTHKSKY